MGPPLAPTRIRRARCLRRACRVCKALIASVGQQLPERSRNTVLAGETATRHGHTMDTRYPTIWLSGQHPEPSPCGRNCDTPWTHYGHTVPNDMALRSAPGTRRMHLGGVGLRHYLPHAVLGPTLAGAH